MAIDAGSSDDHPVGEKFSKHHHFTPEQATAFARAAGDDNPLHHDAGFARASVYGAMIVSGTHTTALMLGLAASHFAKRGPVVGVAFSQKFIGPVFMNDHVLIEWTVASRRASSSGNRVIIELEGELRNQAGTICVTATGTLLTSKS